MVPPAFQNNEIEKSHTSANHCSTEHPQCFTFALHTAKYIGAPQVLIFPKMKSHSHSTNHRISFMCTSAARVPRSQVAYLKTLTPLVFRSSYTQWLLPIMHACRRADKVAPFLSTATSQSEGETCCSGFNLSRQCRRMAQT